MNALDGILETIRDEPGDPTHWLILADWLEEEGQTARAELLRLQRSLPDSKGAAREKAAGRVRELLAEGIRPCLPAWFSSCGMELALIPAGRFRMGSPVRELRRMDDEPLHDVQITRAFYMGIHPVTQQEYKDVTGRNPSYFTARRRTCPGQDTRRFPVESVSWEQSQSFCRKLTRTERTVARGWEYRLPTEAEWEYACRAWQPNRFPFHFGLTLTTAQANFNGEFPYPPHEPDLTGTVLDRPTPVGTYRPNGFGLFDMHGNIDEWVADWFDVEYYRSSPLEDPQGPEAGDGKVIRGGSWLGQGEDCRAAVRIGHDPEDSNHSQGFRVVFAPLRSTT
jgi:uncharacterized protein (TIGR02996 family)